MAIKTFTTGEVLTASDTNTYLNDAGLVLITSGITVSSTGGTAATVSNGTVTIGTSNTAVTVSGAFSATYNNYRIIVTNSVGSAVSNVALKLGASTTGYYDSGQVINYSGAGITGVSDNNAAAFTRSAVTDTTNWQATIELYAPFLATRTFYRSEYFGASQAGYFTGLHTSATSHTQFTLTPDSPGTITGGTIRVYGYRQV